MKGKIRIICGIAIGILLFCSLLEIFTMLLKPKWYFQYPGIEPATKIMDGFYAEPENTLDVIYLGSSNIFRGVNPLIVYNAYGITGYVLGSSIQRMWISEFYLKEALKYQKPKVVVLDVLSAFNDAPNEEDRNRKALDYARFSIDKLKAIRDSIPQDDSESFLSYIFPIMRYHARWNELTKEDFKYLFSDKQYFLKGYDAVFSSAPQEMDFDNTSSASPQSTKAIGHLNNIVEICKRNDIKLILIKTPVTLDWTKGNSASIQKYAEEKGIPFIDYNQIYLETGINPETDYSDVVHLNAYGAEKLSLHLGNAIREAVPLEDRRLYDTENPKSSEDDLLQKWDQSYQNYHEETLLFELSADSKKTSYFQRWNNPNFIIFIVKKGQADSWIGIMEGDRLAYGNIQNGKQKYSSNINGLKVTLSSDSAEDAGEAEIIIDGVTYSKNQPGYNVVVYDTLLRKVADICWFTDDSETIWR